MPKLPHEAIVQLLRNAPGLLLELLWPDRSRRATSVRITQTEFVDVVLAEYRADDVLLFGDDADAPDGALVVEVQLRVHPQKPSRWPILVAGPHARYRCPVDLVVVAVDRDVAAWARRPIRVGVLEGAMTLTPTVLGPDEIPIITDFDEARRSPELAVLSALAHVDAPEVVDIAAAALAASHDLDNDRGILYPDAILARVGGLARKILEKLMQSGRYEFQSDFAKKYFAEGKAEGKAEGEAQILLQILQFKGFTIADALREQVAACRDPAQLEAWVDRALRASSLAEIFDE
ncbi:MAG: hypothetical protein R3B09_12710 [Nannocystaceae bacterium]